MIDCNKAHFQLGGGHVRVWGDPGAVAPNARVMNKTQKFRTWLCRKPALWGLVAALALLLALGAGVQGSWGAEEQGGQGAEAQGSRGAGGQSPISNLQSPISITYAYDAAGRLVSADYGGGAGIAYSYDAAGNLVGASSGGRNLYLPLALR